MNARKAWKSLLVVTLLVGAVVAAHNKCAGGYAHHLICRVCTRACVHAREPDDEQPPKTKLKPSNA